VYVKEIQALFSEAIKSNFQSGDQKITINKWLKPNETMDISGEWLFSTLGIKDNNIMVSVPNYATFKVKIFPF
jgi:hypothetical protein